MMNTSSAVAVITIDGPTASGKGTVAHGVAQALGWHVLDSGVLYRLSALAAIRHGLDGEDAATVAAIAARAAALDVRFEAHGLIFEGEDVSATIRQEAVGNLASRIAAYPEVRAALLARQRAFRQAPGLVADGRDMGSVVFPDAALKVFLTSHVEIRAQRRYKQLIEKGIAANMADLICDMRARDSRDANRLTAPLAPCEGAKILDSSSLTVEQTVAEILGFWQQAQA